MNGKKTYIVAALMILHALLSYAMGQDVRLDLQEIFGALGLAALRSGVKKAEPGEGPKSLAPGLLALLLGSATLATAAEPAANTEHGTRNTSAPGLYFDSFASARTPDFQHASYGYGLGVGYQVTKHWGGDLRVIHHGFDADGSVVQSIGGRLVARMPFELLSPYTFLGGTFDLERDEWRLQPGGGIEFGVSKRLRGLSLFAEGGLDADLRGQSGYLFTTGIRWRF